MDDRDEKPLVHYIPSQSQYGHIGEVEGNKRCIEQHNITERGNGVLIITFILLLVITGKLQSLVSNCCIKVTILL